jgi:hypothetical protein
MDEAVQQVQERKQLVAQRARVFEQSRASHSVGLCVAFALNNVVAVYQKQGGYGRGDRTADDAEELLARLQRVEWEGLTRIEMERLVEVLHAFMLDIEVCLPAFLDFAVPAWTGARRFLHEMPVPAAM